MFGSRGCNVITITSVVLIHYSQVGDGLVADFLALWFKNWTTKLILRRKLGHYYSAP